MENYDGNTNANRFNHNNHSRNNVTWIFHRKKLKMISEEQQIIDNQIEIDEFKECRKKYLQMDIRSILKELGDNQGDITGQAYLALMRAKELVEIQGEQIEQLQKQIQSITARAKAIPRQDLRQQSRDGIRNAVAFPIRGGCDTDFD